MAKNKIITSQGNVQFINSKGRTIDMHPMHCYAIYENDTVSFLFIYMKEYSGQAFFASQYEDLELNGETYDSLDELKDAINYEFAKAGAQARTEIVTELPEDPFTNTIYLLPKEHGQGYDEYIWNEDEGWQLIGDTDIEFERYLKIEDFNPYSADTKDYIDAVSGNTVQNASDIVSLSGAIDTEISARTDADTALSGAIDSVASDLADEVSARTQADTTLQNNITAVNNRVDAEQIARANADTAISGAVDSVSGAVSTLSGEVQTMGDEAIVDAEYVSSSTTIDFYNASGAVVSQIDATPFITDGMIDDVRIETISGVTYLVIDFNTASGIEDIQIPLTDFFNPDNYYDKDAIDGIVSDLEAADSVISGAVDNVSSDLATESQRAQNAEGVLSGAIDTKLAISDFNTYSASVETALSGKANASDVYTKSEVYTKAEVDEAISEIDLSEYYTKTETDGKLADKADLSALTEDERVWGEALNNLNSRINNVSGDVADKADVTALTQVNNALTSHTANTNVHVTSAEKATWNAKSDFSGDYNDLTNKLSAGTNITISGNVISAEGGGSVTVDTALDSGSTNPVQNQALYNELRLNVTEQTETLLQWEQSDGGESTNYPSGCTKITVEVDENEMTSGGYTLYNDNYDCFGVFAIESNGGVITVSATNCESEPTTSITYSISDNVVTIEYPTITNVTIIGTSYDNYWAIKAISETSTVTPLIDQVSANTTALGGKQDTLSAGTGIDITNDIISVTGGSGISSAECQAMIDQSISGKVDTSDFETYSGNTQTIINGKADSSRLGGLSLVKLTQAEYDVLVDKDSNTLYIISD